MVFSHTIPWDGYIYLHELGLILHGFNVAKYTSPMDDMVFNHPKKTYIGITHLYKGHKQNILSPGTVDGRNPAPPGMVKNPINNGILIILGGARFCPPTV